MKTPNLDEIIEAIEHPPFVVGRNEYELAKGELAELKARVAKLEVTDSDDEDICGLCGEPGADKIAHPVHWPGEQVPDGELVHQACEDEECRRAHAALTDRQREQFLRKC